MGVYLNVACLQVEQVSRRRGTYDEPCAICCEDFREEPQVLLSCGHAFHHACLASWERFSGANQCPVCRKVSSLS